MTEYDRKKAFAEGELKALISAVSRGQAEVYYSAPVKAGRVVGEYITVTYAGGFTTDIDVTADSLGSMAIEIVREVM